MIFWSCSKAFGPDQKHHKLPSLGLDQLEVAKQGSRLCQMGEIPQRRVDTDPPGRGFEPAPRLGVKPTELSSRECGQKIFGGSSLAASPEIFQKALNGPGVEPGTASKEISILLSLKNPTKGKGKVLTKPIMLCCQMALSFFFKLGASSYPQTFYLQTYPNLN